MKAIRRQVKELMAENSIANAIKLQALCDDPDPRISVIAIKEWNDRFWGKISDIGFSADEASSRFDLAHLDDAQRARANELLAELSALLAQGVE